MFTLVFSYLFFEFRKTWKLYLTNILSILTIILLFAYIDGSKRQLNLQNTVFSGELVARFKIKIEDLEGKLLSSIPEINYLNKNKSSSEKTENSALGEISKSAEKYKRTILDDITFENFSYYLGFDKLE